MKTYKNLYARIYSMLHTAYRRVRAGKRTRIDVVACEFDIGCNLLAPQARAARRALPIPTSFYSPKFKRRLASAG